MRILDRESGLFVILTAFLLACVVVPSALLVVTQISSQRVDEVIHTSHRSAEALAQLVSNWLILDTDRHPNRVEQLAEMLLVENTVYIRISHRGETLVDTQAEGWTEPTPSPLPDSRSASTLDSFGGRLVVRSRIYSSGGQEDGTVVEIGKRAQLLEAKLRSIVSWTAGTSAAIWATLLLGFVLLRHRGTPRVPRDEPERNDIPLERAGHIRIGCLRIDTARKIVTYRGSEISLPPKPYRLLELLARHADRVLSDREILAAVWNDTKYPSATDVRQCVYRLRKHLDTIEAGLGRCILNVKGFGYRLDAESLERWTDDSQGTPCPEAPNRSVVVTSGGGS